MAKLEPSQASTLSRELENEVVRHLKLLALRPTLITHRRQVSMSNFYLPSEMVLVAESKVPKYLQKGELFLSLQDGSDDDFSVPSNSLKPDQSVRNDKDLIELLCSLQYWVVVDLPSEIFNYILQSKARVTLMRDVCMKFEDHFPLLYNLRCVVDTLPSLQLKAAVETGSVRILECVHKQMGRELDMRTCKDAAIAGNEDCLLYLFQNLRPLRSSMCDLAAEHRYLMCLEYLHSVDCPWNTHTSAVAAQRGQLTCLTFLIEHGCPVDNTACVYAASKGELECLKYLYSQGLAHHAAVYDIAEEIGQLNVMNYLEGMGYPAAYDVSH